MAETITIPSPSVFLRASPGPPRHPSESEQQPAAKDHKRSPVKKKKRVTPVIVKPSDSAAVSKPKQSKSRNGCVTCKAKRLKCDETKPSCQQCKRRSVECGGYKKDFKWRPFEETNVSTNVTKRKNASPPTISLTSCQKTVQEPSSSSARHSMTESRCASAASQDDISPSFAQKILILPNEKSSASESAGSSTPHDETTMESLKAFSNDKLERKIESTTENSGRPLGEESLAEDPCDNQIILPDPYTLSAPDLVGMDVEDLDFMLDLFPLPELAEEHVEDEFVDEFEEMVSLPAMIPDYDAWALRLASQTSPNNNNNNNNNNIISNNENNKSLARSLGPNVSEPFTYLYEQPHLSESSPEMLTMRFDKLTCGILSVKDGPNENPWRTLLWPMAQTSPALYHAISSMTAFHSSRDVPVLRLSGHEHKSLSLKNLQEGINEGSMRLDTAIATTLALAFAECWDQHISSGNYHINGARTMMNLALAQHRQNPLTGVDLARLKFLCNAWVYLDVLSRITTVDDDQSDDYDQLYCLYSTPINPELGLADHSGFGIDFGMPIDARLDPLMGCASTLFPLIGRVANLVRRVCREESNSPPMISQAMELKLLLETWDPPAFIEPPEDLTSSVEHSLQTAEAYRWATLLYLHQALPEIPGPSSEEIAKKVLNFLATVPLASRAVIVHIYPLTMAGCEAVSEEVRQWVRDRWAAMAQRLRIGPIDKCMDVCEEVWRRRDEHRDSKGRTRRALVSTAELQSLRSKRSFIAQRGGSYSSSIDLDEGWNGFDERRRMTLGDVEQFGASFRGLRGTSSGTMDPEYTVRGRLHWVGVMKDWGWEVLLG